MQTHEDEGGKANLAVIKIQEALDVKTIMHDEKRKKIIRWIINCIDVADKIKYGTDNHRYALAAIRLHRSKLQELDALATKEKS